MMVVVVDDCITNVATGTLTLSPILLSSLRTQLGSKLIVFTVMTINGGAGTPQAATWPGHPATDSDLLQAADHATTTVYDAINNSTLTLPVGSQSTTVANEIALLFQNPNGFTTAQASAVVFPAKSPSTGASASAQKIMHGRFHVFMSADDTTWAWFPYSSFTSYAATQAAAGRPLLVTALYGGTHRPVYFSPSLALDGSNHPTAPSSNWRRLVKTDDPLFINWWVNNYVRPIVYQQVAGQQNLWTGLDECYFIWNTFGVIDDSGVFQTLSNFDSPFPQNESQLLAMLGSFFTQLKTIAPDIKVMPNLASGISDVMLDDPSTFAALYKDAHGVMLENIYTPTATSDFSRSQFYANLTNIYNFGSTGKTALLRANMTAGDATASRTALVIYLLVRGPNFFYAPNLGLNPSTDITAENPTDCKPMWNSLGNPTGALQSTQLGGTVNDRLYSRTTQNGVIYLNWSGATQTVTLPAGAGYVDRTGSVVTQLTIPDLTGDYALLKNAPRGTSPRRTKRKTTSSVFSGLGRFGGHAREAERSS